MWEAPRAQRGLEGGSLIEGVKVGLMEEGVHSQVILEMGVYSLWVGREGVNSQSQRERKDVNIQGWD